MGQVLCDAVPGEVQVPRLEHFRLVVEASVGVDVNVKTNQFVVAEVKLQEKKM